MRPFYLLPIAVLLAGGCAMSAEDRLVGNWVVDMSGTKIPEIPIPELVKPFEEQLRSMHVKLLSDRTFVLSSPGLVEGKWQYKAGEVIFTPAPRQGSGMPRGFDGAAAMFSAKEVHATMDANANTLTVTQNTPVGPVVLRLRKSG